MSVANSLPCEKGGRRRIRVREHPTPSVDDRGRACRAQAPIAQVLGIVYALSDLHLAADSPASVLARARVQSVVGTRMRAEAGGSIRSRSTIGCAPGGYVARPGRVWGGSPVERVNDDVVVNPVREGPRTAADREAGRRIGGRCRAEGMTAPGAASAARAGVRVSLAGRSAVFRRRRFGPALLRKAPRCSCPCRRMRRPRRVESTWAAGLLFGADGVAVTVSLDGTAGMSPWPPRLPRSPRQSRLRSRTSAVSRRARRTFQRPREAAACRI